MWALLVKARVDQSCPTCPGENNGGVWGRRGGRVDCRAYCEYSELCAGTSCRWWTPGRAPQRHAGSNFTCLLFILVNASPDIRLARECATDTAVKMKPHYTLSLVSNAAVVLAGRYSAPRKVFPGRMIIIFWSFTAAVIYPSNQHEWNAFIYFLRYVIKNWYRHNNKKGKIMEYWNVSMTHMLDRWHAEHFACKTNWLKVFWRAHCH